MNGRNYPNLEKAFDMINEAKDASADYVITLKADVSSEKFTLPKTAGSITIRSENENTISVGKATSIAANTNFVIENVAFVTTGKTLTINAKKDLTINGLYGDVTAVKGGTKSALNWYGEDESLVVDISGFGTVNVYGVLRTGKTFNVTKLVFKAENASIVITDAAIKASVKAIDASNGGVIEYAEDAGTVLAFTGKDAALAAAEGALKITGSVTNGQAVLNAKNINAAKLADGITADDSEIEYGFSQIGNSICYMGKVLELYHYDSESNWVVAGKYISWNDVVKFIENANVSEEYKGVYVITLLDDYNANGTIKFPKAGTYTSIEINSENHNFNFTGNITLTGDTYFYNVNIGAVKNGKPAKYTINAGKNELTISDCGTGLLTSINSTGRVVLSNSNADKIKADTLIIDNKVVAKNGITAKIC